MILDEGVINSMVTPPGVLVDRHSGTVPCMIGNIPATRRGEMIQFSELSDFMKLLYYERVRFSSFRHWDIQGVNPALLAQYGFFYYQEPGHVQCVFCGLIISNWSRETHPYYVHRQEAPECPFFQPNSENIPIQMSFDSQVAPPSIRFSIESVDAPSLESYESPAAPSFRSNEKRLQTFAIWPVQLSQRPETLSEAGFYYSGNGDRCFCFQCDIGIKDWEASDDPFFEHARWSPQCSYVILKKGKDFIAEVNKKVQEMNIEKFKLEKAKKAAEKARDVENPVAEENMINITCQVCMNHKGEVILHPCGHAAFCIDCFVKLEQKCPICRQNFKGYLKFYFL